MGYFNVYGLLKFKQPFNFIFAARGTGKTYSALKGALDPAETIKKHSSFDPGYFKDKRFILMRRTESEIDMYCSSSDKTGAGNPFKVINANEGTNIEVARLNKHMLGFYSGDMLVGYALALSTIAKIRGLDFSDVGFLIFDEFNSEKHVQKIAYEGDAFLNAYETINRNRELDGMPPLIAFIMGNSNNIDNDILNTINLTHKVEQMILKGQGLSIIPDRATTITILTGSEISEKKSHTALYKLSSGTKFAQMALENKFSANDFSMVGTRSYNQYRPFVKIGTDISIFRHVSKNEFYMTRSNRPAQYEYGAGDADRRAVIADFSIDFVNAYMEQRFLFETYDLKQIFTRTFLGKSLQIL